MQMPLDNFEVEELICNESFQQYCLGTSLKNQMLWKEWIETLPHKMAEFEEAKKLVTILQVKQGSRLHQLQELKAGLRQREMLHNALEVKTPSFIYKYIVGIAAVVVTAMFLYLYVNAEGASFSSGKALRKTVVLTDGTVITLASQSSIKLQKGFNKTKRELWLSGEAFFDVKHDAEHPFIVHTALNDIKVLGTTFNVNAYPGASLMETTLIQGSVRIESKKDPGYFVILKPNQKLVFRNLSKSKKIYKVSALKISDAQQPAETKWIKNRLDIDNLPLSTIVKKLQDWYGIEFIIMDESVKDYRYSGVFENETLVKTLEALQLSYPFEFEIKQNKIIIKK